MEFQVSLTLQAERDLERIGRHISRDNELAARTFCQELMFEAKSLRTFPQRLGRFAKRPNIRKMPYQAYLIFYKIDEDQHTVQILRFWHAAQDRAKLRLKEEAAAYAG